MMRTTSTTQFTTNISKYSAYLEMLNKCLNMQNSLVMEGQKLLNAHHLTAVLSKSKGTFISKVLFIRSTIRKSNYNALKIVIIIKNYECEFITAQITFYCQKNT